jgi:hypothetical protein
MQNSFSLSIGESYHLKMGKDRIVYAGMPSENVYSIVQRKACGYQGTPGISFTREIRAKSL